MHRTCRALAVAALAGVLIGGAPVAFADTAVPGDSGLAAQSPPAPGTARPDDDGLPPEPCTDARACDEDADTGPGDTGLAEPDGSAFAEPDGSLFAGRGDTGDSGDSADSAGSGDFGGADTAPDTGLPDGHDAGLADRGDSAGADSGAGAGLSDRENSGLAHAGEDDGDGEGTTAWSGDSSDGGAAQKCAPEPTRQADPTGPGTPARPEGPSKPATPAKPATPTKGGAPAESPTKTGTPAEPGDEAASGAPVQPGGAARPGGPAKPAEPTAACPGGGRCSGTRPCGGEACGERTGASCEDGHDGGGECAEAGDDSRCAPGTVEHGAHAGEGGTFNDSVPALAAGGLLIAGAFGAAAHRLWRRGPDSDG